jgi:O-antigen ligase
VSHPADTASAPPARFLDRSGRTSTVVLARDVALLGMTAVAAGALVTVGPRAWLLASVAVAGVAIALVPARAGGRSAIGEALFVSVALAVLFATLNAIRPVGSLTVADLALLGALGLGGLALVADPSSSRKLMPPWWLAAAAAGFLFVGLLVELFPPGRHPQLTDFADPLYAGGTGGTASTNLAGAIRLAGTVLLVPVLVASAADSRRRIHLLAELWIAGVLISALVAVLVEQGVIGYGSGIVHYFWREQGGLTVHPNVLGLTSAMTLPIVIARVGSAGWRRRVYYVAAIAILVGGIGASGSRIALIAGAIGVALVIFLGTATWKLTAVLAAAAVVLVGASFVVDLGSSPVVERIRTEGLVDERRVVLYEEALDAVKGEPILGYGFENLRGVHDVYLQLLQAGGVIALLSFLLFAAGTLTVGIRCGRSADLPPDLRALARGLTTSIAVWLLAVVVLNLVLDRFLYVPVGLLLGIAALVTRRQRSQPSSSIPVSARSS